MSPLPQYTHIFLTHMPACKLCLALEVNMLELSLVGPVHPIACAACIPQIRMPFQAQRLSVDGAPCTCEGLRLGVQHCHQHDAKFNEMVVHPQASLCLRLLLLQPVPDCDKGCAWQDAELALSARRQSPAGDEEVVSNNISAGHAAAAGMSGGMDSVMQDAPQVRPCKPCSATLDSLPSSRSSLKRAMPSPRPALWPAWNRARAGLYLITCIMP